MRLDRPVREALDVVRQHGLCCVVLCFGARVSQSLAFYACTHAQTDVIDPLSTHTTRCIRSGQQGSKTSLTSCSGLAACALASAMYWTTRAISGA